MKIIKKGAQQGGNRWITTIGFDYHYWTGNQPLLYYHCLFSGSLPKAGQLLNSKKDALPPAPKLFTSPNKKVRVRLGSFGYFWRPKVGYSPDAVPPQKKMWNTCQRNMWDSPQRFMPTHPEKYAQVKLDHFAG